MMQSDGKIMSMPASDDGKGMARARKTRRRTTSAPMKSDIEATVFAGSRRLANGRAGSESLMSGRACLPDAWYGVQSGAHDERPDVGAGEGGLERGDARAQRRG